MKTEPEFIFGNSYAVFCGESRQNEFHHNVAFQIVMSQTHDVNIVDEHNNEFSGQVILIRPLIKSKIQCDGRLIHLYLSPSISFTLDLIDLIGNSDIHILQPHETLPINIRMSPNEIIDLLNNLEELSIERLDNRLLMVLDDLKQNLDNPSILQAAKRAGLSRSRVRTLSREQLGVPLSTWITWRKLVKANKALYNGASLTEAALAGHFSDQAHFSRTMKRMFGVTPTEASLIYT